MRPGTRVRAGDRLGDVDMLGVRQEVSSPVDGILGATLVEPGDAVEYGQDLVRIELVSPPAPAAVPPCSWCSPEQYPRRPRPESPRATRPLR